MKTSQTGNTPKGTAECPYCRQRIVVGQYHTCPTQWEAAPNPIPTTFMPFPPSTVIGTVNTKNPMQAQLIHARYLRNNRLEVSCPIAPGDDVEAKKRELVLYADKVLGISSKKGKPDETIMQTG